MRQDQKEWTMADIKRVAAWVREGVSTSEIGNRLGRSYSSVHSLFKRQPDIFDREIRQRAKEINRALNTRWTPDKVEDVIRMVGEGMTYRAIGEKFGVSKNTIVGLMSRKKHLMDQKAKTQTASRQGQALAEKANVLAMPGRFAGTTGRAKTCQWIHGEPSADPDFCGEPTKENSSYCAAHHARCYVKEQPKGRLERLSRVV